MKTCRYCFEVRKEIHVRNLNYQGNQLHLAIKHFSLQAQEGFTIIYKQITLCSSLSIIDKSPENN